MFIIISFLMLTLGFVFFIFLVPLGSRLGVSLRFFCFLRKAGVIINLPLGMLLLCPIESEKLCFIFLCLKVFSDFFIDPLSFLLKRCLVSTGLCFPIFLPITDF